MVNYHWVNHKGHWNGGSCSADVWNQAQEFTRNFSTRFKITKDGKTPFESIFEVTGVDGKHKRLSYVKNTLRWKNQYSDKEGATIAGSTYFGVALLGLLIYFGHVRLVEPTSPQGPMQVAMPASDAGADVMKHLATLQQQIKTMHELFAARGEKEQSALDLVGMKFNGLPAPRRIELESPHGLVRMEVESADERLDILKWLVAGKMEPPRTEPPPSKMEADDVIEEGGGKLGDCLLPSKETRDLGTSVNLERIDVPHSDIDMYQATTATELRRIFDAELRAGDRTKLQLINAIHGHEIILGSPLYKLYESRFLAKPFDRWKKALEATSKDVVGSKAVPDRERVDGGPRLKFFIRTKTPTELKAWATLKAVVV